MILIAILICYYGLVQASYTSPSQNLSFTLNSNLIINSNLSTPIISPSAYVKYSYNQSGWNTLGHYVKYVDACID
jgi:hypothetical protein